MVLLEVEDSIGILSVVFSKELDSSANAVPQYDDDIDAGVITPEESKIIIKP